jgi:hypothetical protein
MRNCCGFGRRSNKVYHKKCIPFYVGPCQHNMARPLVVDGGDGLHKWRVAANVLSKQSWIADKRWSRLVFGREANNSSP